MHVGSGHIRESHGEPCTLGVNSWGGDRSGFTCWGLSVPRVCTYLYKNSTATHLNKAIVTLGTVRRSADGHIQCKVLSVESV